MTEPRLRAVKPDEKPPARKRKALAVDEAAKTGDPRDVLVAMRDRIAKAVADPNCPPRDLAALTKRLVEVVREWRAGKPIPQIFAEDGEPALRTLEAEVIAEFGIKQVAMANLKGGVKIVTLEELLPFSFAKADLD